VFVFLGSGVVINLIINIDLIIKLIKKCKNYKRTKIVKNMDQVVPFEVEDNGVEENKLDNSHRNLTRSIMNTPDQGM
jgi:hypothetical protein